MMDDISKYSILVVDDSPEQIRFVSELLRPEGCRIYAATNCEDAFHLLEQKNFHLILLDIVMPDMDGFTFCEKVKKEERFRDIPVIFATAYHDVENLSRGFQVGGCDYVVKPYIREELLERVKVRIRYAEIRTQLQKANTELDRFCYTLSHDVRAPLYVMKQLAELLMHEIEDENYSEIKEIGEMIAEKAIRTASMADGLHRFSKALYEPLHYEWIDLDLMVSEVYEDLYTLQEGRTIVFQKEKLGNIKADMQLIRVVVMNVISNAIKFTAKCDQAQIKVHAKQYAQEKRIIVEDNGIGFDNENVEELFQVFRRLHEAEYAGDGIGLATVKRIMERHRGRVLLEGKEGKGACVTLVFPIVE